MQELFALQLCPHAYRCPYYLLLDLQSMQEALATQLCLQVVDPALLSLQDSLLMRVALHQHLNDIRSAHVQPINRWHVCTDD